jgi:hypothetical protein
MLGALQTALYTSFAASLASEAHDVYLHTPHPLVAPPRPLLLVGLGLTYVFFFVLVCCGGLASLCKLGAAGLCTAQHSTAHWALPAAVMHWLGPGNTLKVQSLDCLYMSWVPILGA